MSNEVDPTTKHLTEQQFRLEALANAVRHRVKEETADDVVKSAQKYYDFLRGKAE